MALDIGKTIEIMNTSHEILSSMVCLPGFMKVIFRYYLVTEKKMVYSVYTVHIVYSVYLISLRTNTVTFYHLAAIVRVG